MPLTIPDIIAEGDALFARCTRPDVLPTAQAEGAATSKALPDPYGYRREPCWRGVRPAPH